MSRAALVAVVLGALAAGCSQVAPAARSTEEGGWREPAIVNGQRDYGHPEVGLLELRLPDEWTSSCTGTLIGSRTVLTAAHCIVDTTGFSFTVDGESYEASEWKYHPDYSNGDEGMIADVGIAKLQEAPPSSIPRAILSGNVPAAGQGLSVVGFGMYASDKPTDGVKRIASNVIDSVEAHEFLYSDANGGVACLGDSGGPIYGTLDGQEVQIGVTSWGENKDCTGSKGAMRVDTYFDWILEQAGDDITLEKNSPELDFVSSGAESNLPASFVVHAIAKDIPSGIDKLELYVDDKLVESASREQLEGDEALLGARDIPPGQHRLRLEAKDRVGNHSSTTSTITVADTIGPELTIRSPSAGDTVPARFTVAVEAKDVTGGASPVQLYIDGKLWPVQSNAEASNAEASNAAPSAVTSIEVYGLAPGQHEIWVAAEDGAGNASYAQMAITVDATAALERCTATGSACQLPNTLVGGCTVSGTADARGVLWPLLGLLACLVGARRRRRRSSSEQGPDRAR